MATVTIEKAFENLIREAAIGDEDQKAVIGFLRLLESLNDHHSEKVLKKLITFMKIHGKKLEETTDEQLHIVYERLIEEAKKRDSKN